ncbi:uncharacterized protein V1510DRAFT_414738 [Dipodascopsis tothii]|uniref:uncharacterized protein n=1 Tax=Dipodascopsis tothii TaxID=44089 RepID=UPI0034CE04F5
MADSARKQVVIVGGGYGGVSVAHALLDAVDRSKTAIVVINDRERTVYFPATARNAVADYDDRVSVPYDRLVPTDAGRFVLGAVVAVGDKHVELESGETVPFDVLVLAPGSHWRSFNDVPLTTDAIATHWKGFRERVHTAHSIVALGAGAVNLELMGEIAANYPNKELYVVHGHDRVLKDHYPMSLRKDTENILTSMGVQFKLGARGRVVDGGVELPTGETLKADLIVPSAGGRRRTEFLPAEWLVADGSVRVRPSLQTVQRDDIFVAGDAVDMPKERNAGNVHGQVSVIVDNVKAVLANKDPKKRYKPSGEVLSMTFGQRRAVGIMETALGFVRLPAALVSRSKNSDFESPRFNRSLNY